MNNYKKLKLLKKNMILNMISYNLTIHKNSINIKRKQKQKKNNGFLFN